MLFVDRNRHEIKFILSYLILLYLILSYDRIQDLHVGCYQPGHHWRSHPCCRAVTGHILSTRVFTFMSSGCRLMNTITYTSPHTHTVIMVIIYTYAIVSYAHCSTQKAVQHAQTSCHIHRCEHSRCIKKTKLYKVAFCCTALLARNLQDRLYSLP